LQPGSSTRREGSWREISVPETFIIGSVNWIAELPGGRAIQGPALAPYTELLGGAEPLSLALGEGEWFDALIRLDGMGLARVSSVLEITSLLVVPNTCLIQESRRRLRYSVCAQAVVGEPGVAIIGQQIALVQTFVDADSGKELVFWRGFRRMVSTGKVERFAIDPPQPGGQA